MFLFEIDGFNNVVVIGSRFFVFLLNSCCVGLICIFVGGVFLWFSKVRNVFELVLLYFNRIFFVCLMVFLVFLFD